jgi:hypothetical protein
MTPPCAESQRATRLEALVLGSGGRRFKSSLSNQHKPVETAVNCCCAGTLNRQRAAVLCKNGLYTLAPFCHAARAVSSVRPAAGFGGYFYARAGAAKGLRHEAVIAKGQVVSVGNRSAASSVEGIMNTASNRSPDLEAILDGLCDSKIDGSISWIWDGRFYAVLGDPKLADAYSLPTIRSAVLWLRDAARQQFPNSDFAQKAGGPISKNRSLKIEDLLADLYASEINATISWNSRRRFRAVLGNRKVAEARSMTTVRDAVLWLRDAACQHLPDSEFAKNTAVLAAHRQRLASPAKLPTARATRKPSRRRYSEQEYGEIR